MSFHAIVFFPDTKTADAISVSSVSGKATVGQISKVRWSSKTYNAKVIYLGTKSSCEGNIEHVTDNGALNERFFTVADSATSQCAEPQGDSFSFADVGRQLKAAVDELQEQVKLTRTTTTAAIHELEIKMHDSIMRLDRRLMRIEASIDELKMKAPDGSEGAIDFTILCRERVEALLAHKCGNMSKFAFALEKEVYKENPEILLNIEQRRRTTREMNFIREA
ncbi:unnamed protein product [Heligmosomoides polygyrus]|uniref:Tektin n=1 Tax=Heligmosomoides polygyrus TaxID=6339 RepID=A0A183FQ84_HELPZ|nr:unnamed protein product [Heligmosomoides polygyrus]